ncbi:hypothetical protein CARUB_v10015941mg [Capsella rubella]|uniref:RNase H type-1 domain-containing protein n=1 Tax=Capsella rubella TaxID=81985 RepID=R0HS76_9BRAS|nr:hypothetical protein CARUB_v10015941mg [Capsella rubella]
MFLGKAFRNALPEGAVLEHRSIQADTAYKRCGDKEDILHISLKCSFAGNVWDLFPALYKPQAAIITSVKELLGVVKTLLILPQVGLGWAPVYPWILWFLWKARNLLLFDNRCGTEVETVLRALTEAKNWEKAKLLQISKSPSPRKELSPPVVEEAFSIFSYASWKVSTRVGGFGWILRDPHKRIALQASSTLAMEPAIKSALALCVSSVAYFSECKELVLLLQSDGYVTEMDGVLANIAMLCSSFSSVSFHFIPRADNFVADALARAAASSAPYPLVKYLFGVLV